MAALLRYLPDGTPDRNFGSDGVLIADLGLPPPELGLSGAYAPEPAIRLSGLTLDRQGRIILSGDFTSAFAPCRDRYSAPHTQAFLARLDPDGRLDASFGAGGAFTPPHLQSAARPALDPSGRVLYSGEVGIGCEFGPGVIGRLDADGALDPHFGEGGVQPLVGLGEIKDLALEGSGRVLVLGPTRRASAAAAPPRRDAYKRSTLYRLTAAGHPDGRFGLGGARTIVLPSAAGQINSLAAAPGGQTYLAGRLRRHRAGGFFDTFLLGRLTPSGALGRRFGHHGWLTASFGRSSSAAALDVSVGDLRRPVLAGNVSSPRLPPGQGIALLRYANVPVSFRSDRAAAAR